MIYLTIKFNDNTQESYVAEEMRITKGFLKIVNSTYGNRAFPKSEILSINVIIV